MVLVAVAFSEEIKPVVVKLVLVDASVIVGNIDEDSPERDDREIVEINVVLVENTVSPGLVMGRTPDDNVTEEDIALGSELLVPVGLLIA